MNPHADPSSPGKRRVAVLTTLASIRLAIRPSDHHQIVFCFDVEGGVSPRP
jgi:hypothetical protein